MRLDGKNGQHLDLSIAGYQFPSSAEKWDANWLMIRIAVQNEDGKWTKTNPSLLTTEVARIVDWMHELGEGRPADSELDFTEPNLAFELVEASSQEVRLRVWFELESRPDWAPKHFAGDDPDLCVDLPVSRTTLAEAAQQLRHQLYEFPPRAGMP